MRIKNENWWDNMISYETIVYDYLLNYGDFENIPIPVIEFAARLMHTPYEDFYNYLKGKYEEDYIDGIREIVVEMIPDDWIVINGDIEDIVDEIHFRIDGLDNFEARTKACMNYILQEGEGDKIGIDLLINEMDDCRIWDYLE
jgi:hypothetical protein